MEDRVSLRQRALALQDGLVSCILVSVVVAGTLTLAIRFGLIPYNVVDKLTPQDWAQALLGLAVVSVVFLAVWFARLWLRRRTVGGLGRGACSTLPRTAGRQRTRRDRSSATALLIDAALSLDDRFSTSHSII